MNSNELHAANLCEYLVRTYGAQPIDNVDQLADMWEEYCDVQGAQWMGTFFLCEEDRVEVGIKVATLIETAARFERFWSCL